MPEDFSGWEDEDLVMLARSSNVLDYEYNDIIKLASELADRLDHAIYYLTAP